MRKRTVFPKENLLPEAFVCVCVCLFEMATIYVNNRSICDLWVRVKLFWIHWSGPCCKPSAISLHCDAIFKQYNVSFRSGLTERRDQVVNTPASYLRGPGFDSVARRPAILIEIFRGFSQSLQENAGLVP
jgi:hypothetical protein